MRTEINMSPTARPLWGWSGLLLALLVISPAGLSAADEVPKRRALVYMSDGTEYEGILQLTPGIDMKLTKLPGGGDEKTGTVDLDDIRAKQRVFTFNFDVVKEMTFSPLNEEYLKKFKILNISNKEAEVKKVRIGLPYPVLKPKCKVLFNSGETANGVLGTRSVFLTIIDPDTGFTLETKKFVVRSKYSGEPGQSLEDLVHVQRIKMLDEGAAFARNMVVDFRSFKIASADAESGIRAMTQDTLSRVVVKNDADGKPRVHSSLGENVFLAAQVDGRWVAGWPAEGTKRTDLFKSVETEVLKVQDYYTEKKMLGIISEDRDRKITVLVRLRRDIADPVAALAWAKGTAWGPNSRNFEMDEHGELMEFYRLSIWRFVRDNETGKMTLIDRGTFNRTRIKLEEDTPEMGIAPDLWPVVMKDGKLIVGGK
jgi:hypothetical protein